MDKILFVKYSNDRANQSPFVQRFLQMGIRSF